MSAPLANGEVLRRQIYPLWWHPTVPKIDSAAFTPRMSEPNGRISCLRGYVEPADAWHRYFGGDPARSIGTFGVSVAEADASECSTGDDSHELGKPEDHAYIEVTAESVKAVTRKARRLAAHATQRGPLFTP